MVKLSRTAFLPRQGISVRSWNSALQILHRKSSFSRIHVSHSTVAVRDLNTTRYPDYSAAAHEGRLVSNDSLAIGHHWLI